MLSDQARHPVLQKNLRAHFSRACFQRPYETDARRRRRLTLGSHWSASLHLRPSHSGGMILSRSGVAGRARALVVRCFIDKYDSMSDQPFKRRRAIVGKRADNFLVIVTVIGETVGFDYRPVGEV